MSAALESAKFLPVSARLAALFDADRDMAAADWQRRFPGYAWVSSSLVGWRLWWLPIETLWREYGAADPLPADAGNDLLDAVAAMRNLYADYMAARHGG